MRTTILPTLFACLALGFTSISLLAVVKGENGIETEQIGRYHHTYVKAGSPLFADENRDTASEILNTFIEKCKLLEINSAVYIQLPDEKIRTNTDFAQGGL